ncbi:His Kinase A domain containing protein [Modicella reniformis]|uniref:histidine kinase n=1 Tax=Modicella reniformis TaxID=1440133 RepID=A0A9P6LRU6_9FUNG|nr:His Kinase A domain containing protein [Modicella reniformis]
MNVIASPGSTQSNSPVTGDDRQWTNGETLNWIPGFTKGLPIEGFDSYPSPITAAEASSRSLKSVQRQNTGHPHESEQFNNCASVGLDTISATGNMCSSLTALDSNMNNLKGKARTRRVSESVQRIPSSNQLNTELAERRSGFTQNMRPRPPLLGDNLTPPSSLSSSESASVPLRSSLIRHGTISGEASKHWSDMNGWETDKNVDYENWDDFLGAYSQGHFHNIQPRPPPRPRFGPEFPPLPSYVEMTNEANPPPFLAAPLPPNEDSRLKALYSFQILQTDTDVNFQRVAQLVATVMSVSGCMITLVDHDYVSVKANWCAENMDCRRDQSLSGHAILRAPNDPLVVLDTTLDWRFKDLPVVTGAPGIPGVRFYAGAALATSDRYNIGSLCVIDPNPRTKFTEKEKSLLIDLAAVVMREMELWNDQVQLCTRTRMMRDITRWVRERLDRSGNKLTSSGISTFSQSNTEAPTAIHTLFPSTTGGEDGPNPTPVPAVISGSLTGTAYKPAHTTPPFDPALPTPTSSPTLPTNTQDTSADYETKGFQVHDRLEDVAFPSACSMIRASMNVDAVYLVQTTTPGISIPLSRPSRSWGKLGTNGRSKGSAGTLGGGEMLTPPKMMLTCLASSKMPADTSRDTHFDGLSHRVRRQGNSWICTDEGCRPHRLGDQLLNAVEPEWERDIPIISEMLSYLRQEKPVPTRDPGQCSLFTRSQASEEEDIYESSSDASIHGIKSERLLCHTFQGTLPDLSAGHSSPFRSCVVMPIRGASPGINTPIQDEEPWAYFVVLSSSRTKQFSGYERIYLKNFGSCLITEVLKRRVEAADTAKGTFIKSISHELRTPLHIIMGTLELLYADPDDTLSDHQLSLIASAEAAGKGLIDIINNIIDLANLDPDNVEDSPGDRHKHIRELCEQVAGSMTRSCMDKNLVVVPTLSKPSLASLSSMSMTMSISTSVPSPILGVAGSVPIPVHSRTSLDDSINGIMSSTESQQAFSSTKHSIEQKTTLELIVAVDEPEKDPGEEVHWNFVLNLPVIKRILTQLLENAIKFTTTGFVEISAVSPPLSTIPLKPPQAGSRPILFTVRDTGKGISPEFIEGHLFERFTQEDPLHTGTGLGLALVKLLVESLGGWLEIWSEGKEGKGCVVRVLLWAMPKPNMIKSLKDEDRTWREKSCRLYTGESNVSTDRLWKIMGERMMGQELNMDVQKGDEQDFSPEDMMKDLSDQSPCDLLVFNDDLPRLKAYLSYWMDLHATAMSQESLSNKEPVPLLMLISMWKEKKARTLIEAYKKSWFDYGQPGRAVTVVLMPKPVGPLKLLRCLRACFADIDDVRSSQGSHEDELGSLHFTPIPPLRSVTVPHIKTMALGFQNTRPMSSGTMIKSSFKFPASPKGIHGINGDSVPPHSPGGQSFYSNDSRTRTESISTQQSEDEGTILPDKASKRQRSIRHFISQRTSSSKSLTKKASATEESML